MPCLILHRFGFYTHCLPIWILACLWNPYLLYHHTTLPIPHWTCYTTPSFWVLQFCRSTHATTTCWVPASLPWPQCTTQDYCHTTTHTYLATLLLRILPLGSPPHSALLHGFYHYLPPFLRFTSARGSAHRHCHFCARFLPGCCPACAAAHTACHAGRLSLPRDAHFRAHCLFCSHLLVADTLHRGSGHTTCRRWFTCVCYAAWVCPHTVYLRGTHASWVGLRTSRLLPARVVSQRLRTAACLPPPAHAPIFSSAAGSAPHLYHRLHTPPAWVLAATPASCRACTLPVSAIATTCYCLPPRLPACLLTPPAYTCLQCHHTLALPGFRTHCHTCTFAWVLYHHTTTTHCHYCLPPRLPAACPPCLPLPTTCLHIHCRFTHCLPHTPALVLHLLQFTPLLPPGLLPATHVVPPICRFCYHRIHTITDLHCSCRPTPSACDHTTCGAGFRLQPACHLPPAHHAIPPRSSGCTPQEGVIPWVGLHLYSSHTYLPTCTRFTYHS